MSLVSLQEENRIAETLNGRRVEAKTKTEPQGCLATKTHNEPS